MSLLPPRATMLSNAHENLCAYDLRNPDSCVDTSDPEEVSEAAERAAGNIPCSCDNCFYGRTSLARQIISLLDFVTA